MGKHALRFFLDTVLVCIQKIASLNQQKKCWSPTKKSRWNFFLRFLVFFLLAKPELEQLELVELLDGFLCPVAQPPQNQWGHMTWRMVCHKTCRGSGRLKLFEHDRMNRIILKIGWLKCCFRIHLRVLCIGYLWIVEIELCYFEIHWCYSREIPYDAERHLLDNPQAHTNRLKCTVLHDKQVYTLIIFLHYPFR